MWYSILKNIPSTCASLYITDTILIALEHVAKDKNITSNTKKHTFIDRVQDIDVIIEELLKHECAINQYCQGYWDLWQE